MIMSENKPLLLLIESATDCCSVALCRGNDTLDEIFEDRPRTQAALLAPMVEQLLVRNSISLKDCDAVAISEGPGSYTGLRVGLSLAKGLCYGAGRPLIAVNTLAAMAQCAVDTLEADSMNDSAVVIPMIDARRMEVYSAVFTPDGRTLAATEAKVLDSSSYQEYMDKSIFFTGDGSEKFRKLLEDEGRLDERLVFMDARLKASGMRIAASKAYAESDFKDVAYFEPFYLKDFVAGKPKKLL